MKKFINEGDSQNGFEAWGGYMHAKISKLEEQYSSKAARDEQVSNIFSGISIYVNGYTKPSADELKTIMSKNGGIYHTYQRSDDYIIASNLPDTKVKKQSLAKVVKPEWIMDSLSANCLLDYKQYLLYSETKSQPKLKFISTAIPGPSKKSQDNLVGDVIQADQMHGDKKSKSLDTMSNSKLRVTEMSDIVKSRQNATKTAANPSFISEFYNKSRLHHISQLGANFKQYINEMRCTNDFQFPARALLKQMILQNPNSDNSVIKFEGSKIIMHIDMDCFFVSVGLRNKPELLGKPVAVTHGRSASQSFGKRTGVDRDAEFNLYKQRHGQVKGKVTCSTVHVETKVDYVAEEADKYGSMSEIASCSYEARAKGVSNGMFMGPALKLCPDLIAINYDFEGYKEVAYTLYDTITKYTLDVEAVSCDEMYVDCTELITSLSVRVQDLASALRQEIKLKTNCPCSTGFGSNRLQSRLATKLAKPDGQYFLTANNVYNFMTDIKLRDIPGVGRHTSQKLEAMGHQTCGSLQMLPLSVLQHHLGNKTGAQLYEQCRGRDSNPLNFNSVRKSVSAEVNYGIRFENYEQCTQFLCQLSAEVHQRMQQLKVSGKCITLKLMVRAREAPVETAKYMGHGFCNIISKSVSLSVSTNDLQKITNEVLGICKKQKIDPKEMRGVGIQISKLENIAKKNVNGTMSQFLKSKELHLKKNLKSPTIQTTPKKSDFISIENKKSPILTPKRSDNVYESKKSPMITPRKGVGMSPSKKRSPLLSYKSPTKRRKQSVTKSLNFPSVAVMNNFLQGNVYKHQQAAIPQANNIGSNPTSVAQTNSNPSDMFPSNQLHWRIVRDMLRAWLDCNTPPMQCDITFLETYLTEMVTHKLIDKVKVLMSFLKRKTLEIGSQEWLDAYVQVHDEVQHMMMVVYGKQLFI